MLYVVLLIFIIIYNIYIIIEITFLTSMFIVPTILTEKEITFFKRTFYEPSVLFAMS